MPGIDLEYQKQYHQEWNRNNRAKVRAHKYKHRYGISSLEAVNELKSQPCRICNKNKKRMVIDHAHEPHNRKFNQTYRGVLCHSCNVSLGWFEKNKENVNKYLEGN